MFAVIAAFAVAALPMLAQTKPSAAIPATAPTTSVSDLPSAHPALPAAKRRGESELVWSGAVLTVRGNGDSLRNILRGISKATGMKVTGGVPDELVFGSYGPAPVQQVLSQLFDGLNVNLALMNEAGTKPKELILTARTGGVTSPSSRPLSDDESDAVDRPAVYGPQRQFGATGGGNQPAAAPSLPPDQQPGAAVAPVDNAAPSASDQPASPNGVRTPEQIFEELRKRQQQQSGSAPPTQ